MLIMKLIDTEEKRSVTMEREVPEESNAVDYSLDMLADGLCGLGYAKYEFLIKDDPDDEDNYNNEVIEFINGSTINLSKKEDIDPLKGTVIPKTFGQLKQDKFTEQQAMEAVRLLNKHNDKDLKFIKKNKKK